MQADQSVLPNQDSGLHYRGRPIGLLLIIGYKAIWGIIEVVSGILLLYSYQIITKELIEDPQDQLARWILDHVYATNTSHVPIVALFISFGILKILLALCLWFRIRFVREIGLIFFSLVACFGVYSLITHFSLFILVVLAADVSALYYFLKILPKHLGPHMMYQ